MSTRSLIFLSLLLLAVLGIYSLAVYPSLPLRVPIHWNLRGEADGWGSRTFLMLLWPSVEVGLLLLALGLPKISPRQFDVRTFLPTFNYLMFLVIGLMAFLQFASFQAALHPDFHPGRTLFAGIMLFCALMGNMLGKTRKNPWVGYRTPWTLASDRVWAATHRLAARLMVGSGLLCATAILLGAPIGPVFLIFLGIILFPAFYSYILYRRWG